MFQESDYTKACQELESPQKEEGFEFFTESQGVTIHRQYNEESGLYQYKVYGILDDVLPETCAQVYLDLDYRKIWDKYVSELYETEADGKKVVYWDVTYPWPMSHRDYVYVREYREIQCGDKKVYAVMAWSEAVSTIPEKSGVIRVRDYLQSCCLTTDGKVGTKAFMRYYDNPGGIIPTWLINWGAKTGVPSFLTMMQDACRGYPEYLRSKQNTGSS